jgi:hypothetical protein
LDFCEYCREKQIFALLYIIYGVFSRTKEYITKNPVLSGHFGFLWYDVVLEKRRSNGTEKAA